MKNDKLKALEKQVAKDAPLYMELRGMKIPEPELLNGIYESAVQEALRENVGPENVRAYSIQFYHHEDTSTFVLGYANSEE